MNAITQIEAAAWRWPLLSEIGLSAAAKVERNLGIGGSDANVIMGGDVNAILNLWRCKRGEAEPENLDDVLPVLFGQWTEDLNRQWYERRTGRDVIGAGRVCVHDEYSFMRCTLDGSLVDPDAIWEAKTVNAFAKADEVVAKYLPQLTHNMICAGVERAVLSVFFGTMKWEAFSFELDPLYAADVIEAERAFWACVESGEPPYPIAVSAAPLPEKLREVDLGKSNSWVANAKDWLANKAGAAKFETATKELKALVEPDVGRAFGAGVQIKRAKNGNLTISEIK